MGFDWGACWIMLVGYGVGFGLILVTVVIEWITGGEL